MQKVVEFLRAAQIHRTDKCPGRFPISRSLWFRWVSEGFAPPPVKIGGVCFWRKSDIDSFAEKLSSGG
jgi:predicted DNA-binding transcriptional regulator AlpA